METFAATVLLITGTSICNSNKINSQDGPFLENVINYPSDEIRLALLQSMPGMSKTPSVSNPNIKMDTQITQSSLASTPAPEVTKVFGRVGVDKENWITESPACETTVRAIMPRQGLGVDGQYRLIVNDQLYQQKIYTQMCKYNDTPCGEIQADLRSGYESICLQSYSDVELLTFRNDSLQRDVFQLPVSCDCYLRSYLFT